MSQICHLMRLSVAWFYFRKENCLREKPAIWYVKASFLDALIWFPG